VANLAFRKLVEFRVFNRWGNELISTTDNNKGWDGRYGGVPQDPGDYHYLIRIVEPNGQQQTFKGTVTLVR
jgi:gliding motility-associated-like protein